MVPDCIFGGWNKLLGFMDNCQLCQPHGTVRKLHGAGWDLIGQFGNLMGNYVNFMGVKINIEDGD